jgi:hypothetical protein
VFTPEYFGQVSVEVCEGKDEARVVGEKICIQGWVDSMRTEPNQSEARRKQNGTERTVDCADRASLVLAVWRFAPPGRSGCGTCYFDAWRDARWRRWERSTIEQVVDRGGELCNNYHGESWFELDGLDINALS